MTIDPLALMTDVEAATDALLADIPADVAAPSRLPGWTVGHVLTHLARNADALTNLLTWARTGVETPAYASPEARAAGIEAGAARPLADQVADLRQAHERFTAAAAAMPAEAWAAELPMARSAAAVPWLRLCEVEMHRADLGHGYTPDDWPAAFALRLLRSIAAAPPEGTPPMTLRPDGLEHTLVIGDGAPEISGPARTIAGWLTGRSDGTGLTVSPDGELPRPARFK
ncbi:maleylpyruvate isomerase family mycothiol-dependent enzyme [Actinoplanes couchii]|uniref:Maleylpyruvate isomerase n=1 Tax=Actinoplanes couchii TaxID=403638 RepID=A0ABQ3X2L1_9ACTN|nr:maleylpyruvate isomerase family mycothiol-dependent enzyme [Actinoplanes couchii]MDR6322520.1 maleylpyruvate isomerase [Actinoplanes couchii]GID52752.1 maleylpyruvate isomerase [Actinoplanes couchii]